LEDQQLLLDIDCDNATFQALRQSKIYAVAASEETPLYIVGGTVYHWIRFDPLDGSSTLLWESIYGLWKSTTGVLGLTGRDQVASAIALYGYSYDVGNWSCFGGRSAEISQWGCI